MCSLCFTCWRLKCVGTGAHSYQPFRFKPSSYGANHRLFVVVSLSIINHTAIHPFSRIMWPKTKRTGFYGFACRHLDQNITKNKPKSSPKNIQIMGDHGLFSNGEPRRVLVRKRRPEPSWSCDLQRWLVVTSIWFTGEVPWFFLGKLKSQGLQNQENWGQKNQQTQGWKPQSVW